MDDPINNAKLPDFEVPGQTKTFDLLEVLPDRLVPKTGFADALAFQLQDHLRAYLFKKAVKKQLQDAVPVVAQLLRGRNAGYLLRINVYTDDGGVAFAPGGSLVSFIGTGREPLDALAEAYRAPAIRAAQAVGLNDGSSYVWLSCTKNPERRNDVLHATAIPAPLARGLERQARMEAERRTVAGGVYTTAPPEALEQVRQAEFWRQVLRQRVADVSNAASKKRIEDLNRSFEAAQLRFNQAYADYQLIEREMAEHERETAVLEAIDGVLSLTKAGLQAQAIKASAKAGSAPKAPMSQENVTVWRASRETVLRGVKETVTLEAKGSYEDLIKIQAALSDRWKAEGVSTPAPPPINIKPF